MSKGSFSPRVIVRSPKSLADTAVQFSRLPDIKIKHSLNETKKTEATNELINDFKSKHKVINFFDIPTPVNEQKLAIVRNTLLQRKTLSPNPIIRDPDENLNLPTRKSYRNPKTELELQIDFLREKKQEKGKKKQSLNESLSKESNFSNQSINSNIEKDLKSPSDCPFLFNQNEKNQIHSTIKKSESMLVLPSDSPTKPLIDLNLSPVTPQHQIPQQPDSLISSLLTEIDSLKIKNQLLQQDLVSQQQSFDQLNRNFIDQKQLMSSEISSLNSELSSMKIKNKELENEISYLTSEKTRLRSELELSLINKNDSESKIEAKIYLLKEEINEKQQEYEDAKEQLKISENNRKKVLEISKDLEIELIITKKHKENLEKDFNELNFKHEALLNEFRIERSKALVVDDLQQEVFQANYEISLIKDENKELALARSIAQESLETVQKNFDNSRLAWREKENSYNNTIQDLLEQIQSERAKTQVQAAETAKLRRAITLKDNDSYVGIAKDEISRYQQKLMQIDREHNEAMSEIEKLKRNIEYYRHIVKNKEEVIKKLESGQNPDKTGALVNKLAEMVQCCKCFAIGNSFISHPCLHVLCGACQGAECPICLLAITSMERSSEIEEVKQVKQLIDQVFKAASAN